ncbi:MAG TPA: hypothetical protein VGR39_07725 [Candidatus Acidoferrales bacterium]|nr:hypothetical protein [Candidatus Acidoferrales bacterium]
MSSRKRRKLKRNNAKAKKAAAIKKVMLACAQNAAARPRMKLPDAMRAAGVEEHAIAQCFAEQLQQIRGRAGHQGFPGSCCSIT